ncbi:hypothetical protein niasHT_037414 [Heterodera trifolii]|uniref:Uncharacterized protein n=1 Tax=Heterodera trifolii TaxID=157864 RepID=A0ABD2J6C8_9BILA
MAPFGTPVGLPPIGKQNCVHKFTRLFLCPATIAQLCRCQWHRLARLLAFRPAALHINFTNGANVDFIHADELEQILSNNDGKCSNCSEQHPGFCILCKHLFELTEDGPPLKVFLGCCNSYFHRDCWNSQNQLKCPMPPFDM